MAKFDVLDSLAIYIEMIKKPRAACQTTRPPRDGDNIADRRDCRCRISAPQAQDVRCENPSVGIMINEPKESSHVYIKP